jgi:hypothetical protein
MNQFPPSHLYPIRADFFQLAEMFAAQGAPPLSFISVANGKNFYLQSFNNFVWTPLGTRVYM